MAVKVTFTCDRCGKDADSIDYFKKLVLQKATLNWRGSYVSQSMHSPVMEALWCRSCFDTMGLPFASVVKDEAKRKAPPTLDDIVQEMIDESRET